MIFREATNADAPAIAALHALSWQHTYRGLLTDAFLDSEVQAERLSTWQQRLGTPDPNRSVWLAEDNGQLMGFVCVFAHYDSTYGAFVDNLHAHPFHKKRGIGAQLMRHAAKWAGATGLYLWVLEGNHNARGFYERLGAINHERVVRVSAQSVNNESIELRYIWPEAAKILELFA